MLISFVFLRSAFLIIEVKLKPNAKNNEILGFKNGVLQIRVKDAPIEGRANKALVQLLAKRLKIAKSCIKIKSGETSKIKRLIVECIEENKVFKQLNGG